MQKIKKTHGVDPEKNASQTDGWGRGKVNYDYLPWRGNLKNLKKGRGELKINLPFVKLCYAFEEKTIFLSP